MPPDVLVSGGAPPVRGRPRRALLALTLLALLATAALVADDAVRGREADALVARAAAAQAAITYADRRVAATVAYTMPLLESAAQPASVRTGLARLVEQEAAGQLPPVQRQRVDLARVRVLPWHGPQRRARDRLLSYLDARIGRLQAAAQDARVLFREDPEPDRRLAAARDALAAVAGEQRARSALPP
jgi:hypothetical protein